MPAKADKPTKRPALAPASRYEVLAPTNLPGMEMQDARLLPLDLIDHNPYQARQAFDVDALQELAESIREHGVIEPIIVRPMEGRYEIVAGERRYRAGLIAELSHIPARVMDVDDTQAAIFTALENLQREDLDIEDEGRQFAHLQRLTGLSQRKLAQKLGKERQYISRRIRLLKRPDLLKDYRAGLKTLHQVLSLVGADAEVDDAPEGSQSGSGGPTLDLGGDAATAPAEDSQSGSGGPSFDADFDIELVEREELNGYIVARKAAGGGEAGGARTGGKGGKGGTRFRWRPLQQFSTWVFKMKPEEVPEDERASVKAQVAEIKARLEQLEQALEGEERQC